MKRGGRKEIQLPEGTAQPHPTDNTLVKALARAFRWERMMRSGEIATIAELAEREKIAPSYMTRVLRLTLLAPDLVEAILEGKHGPDLTLTRALEGFPAEWSQQLDEFRPPHIQQGMVGAMGASDIDSRKMGPEHRPAYPCQQGWRRR
ncbi:hypothetical protein [Acuticoccus yangtzensis]|uniref:hypothetical protein n=1 Tax=Acuticoccus yangtzensis TaxID=1443441 RepID=UPI001B3B7E54|nr:hypothetical protein [Acuticoccus yangtzensis]